MPAPTMTALARVGISFMLLFPAEFGSSHGQPAAVRAGPAARSGGRRGRPEFPRRSACRLLDRDLLVDETEVDSLPAPDEPCGDVHDDRQDVHRAHVVERIQRHSCGWPTRRVKATV